MGMAMPTPHTPAASAGRPGRSLRYPQVRLERRRALSAWVSLPVTRIRATFSSFASVLGVEEENGFTLNYDKYNWEESIRIISSCRMLTNPSTSVRKEEHLCPEGTEVLQRIRSADGGTTSARVVLVHQRCAFTVCHQPHPFTALSCGGPQRGGTAYMVQLQLCNVEVHAHVKNAGIVW